MRLVAWNVNHRARRRRIPDWLVPALAAQAPDIVVLTEYVEGVDHDRFLLDLAKAGLAHSLVSVQTKGENQVLIAARDPLKKGNINAPPFYSSVPTNALHAVLPNSGLEVLGFRMPAFSYKHQAFKRETWDWLLSAADQLRSRRAAITGDFNTAPGDTTAYCGDCLEALAHSGWRHVRPESGYSWRHFRSKNGRQIDHAFISPALVPVGAEYSWAFHSFGPDAESGRVGRPDHAMLLTDVA